MHETNQWQNRPHPLFYSQPETALLEIIIKRKAFSGAPCEPRETQSNFNVCIYKERRGNDQLTTGEKYRVAEEQANHPRQLVLGCGLGMFAADERSPR
ncbi:hypothetical protein GN956_G18014 [Arapaima gigas]